MSAETIIVTVPNDPVEVVTVHAPGETVVVQESQEPSPVITIAVPGVQGIQGVQGAQGIQGAVGPSNVLSVGTTTTGEPGSNANAAIVGESPAQTLNLTIPRGDKGDKGDPNVLSVGTVTTLAEDQAAVATITGATPAQVLNLQIPRGYGTRAGGTTGQVLQKISDADYDTGWVTATDLIIGDTIVRRNADAGFYASVIGVANQPTDTSHVTRKDYVDAGLAGKSDSGHTHTDLTNATSAATGSTLSKRDASGSAAFNKVTLTSTTVAADAARKDYVDTTVTTGKRRTGGTSTTTGLTLALTDEAKMVWTFNGTANVPITVPDNATVAFPVGAWIDITGSATNGTTIIPATGVTIRAPDGVTVSAAGIAIRSIGGTVRLTKYTADTWFIEGDLATPADTAVAAAASAGTANTLVKRDANGDAVFRAITVSRTAPTVASELTRKDYVDTLFSTAGRDRGTGAAWPSTDLRRGDAFYHTGVSQLGVYDGTRFILVAPGTVASQAAQDALTWAYPGMRLRRSDTGLEMEYQNATVGWSRAWSQPWGLLNSMDISRAGVISTNQNFGQMSVAGLTKNRRLRRKFRCTFYTGGAAISIRFRIEVYKGGASVNTGTNWDYRIGGSFGDLAHIDIDEEYITAANGTHDFALWIQTVGGEPTSLLSAVAYCAYYIEDLGPSGSSA